MNNPPDFSGFDEVLIFDFENDERDLAGDAYDLYQLKKTFKKPSISQKISSVHATKFNKPYER